MAGLIAAKEPPVVDQRDRDLDNDDKVTLAWRNDMLEMIAAQAKLR
jgi:hypothetical protein